MTIRNKKELRKFLKASINILMILIILFFQYFVPLHSNATCGSNICGPNCISMDPDTCTCFPIGCNTNSTSGTTSGTVMCSTGQPICPSGQSYSCPSGQSLCCINFSNEAGCSTGLSCYGGRGSCVTSTSSTSTSSTTGGVIMCDDSGMILCPSGQNLICPSGQAPCCINFSNEAGCSTGLSCYGGRGFCGTSTTSSTSSTTGGVIMCDDSGMILCPVGQNLICPTGQAPCCINFSNEAGCSTGLSCYGGRGFCGTSTTSSTSSTTGGVIMCDDSGMILCPVGQNLICPTGQAPCCINFSNEAGCSTGLSCYGGRGFCGTSTTSSTSSTTGGVIMCDDFGMILCPVGQNLICPTGQAPCCINFSNEAGCSTGLSCYGGRGFCGTSTTSSTSSTTGGVIMCDDSGMILCPVGQNFVCPLGKAPCCINFSNEAGCSTGLSCYGGEGSCVTSTSSSTSSSGNCQVICPPCTNSNPPCLLPCQIVCSSSSSSSSSGTNVPFCLNGQIMCNSGTPSCTSGSIPDCGSNYGLTNEFAGQGCITQSMNFFFVGAAFCSLSQRVFLGTKQIQICENKENLCPTNRERFKYCREDKTSCKCACQFKTKNASTTPRCNSFNQPACSGKLEPVCSKPNNIPVCLDGKLSCQNKNSNSLIDFTDIISCKRRK